MFNSRGDKTHRTTNKITVTYKMKTRFKLFLGPFIVWEELISFRLKLCLLKF